MKERKILDDMVKLYNEFGFDKEFKWSDTRKLGLENSPIYFKFSRALVCTGRTGSRDNNKKYKLNPEFFKGAYQRYVVKKAPLYPQKMWLEGVKCV